MITSTTKSRKLAWVVLAVVVLAVLSTGIVSWRFLLYEELARLTNQPDQYGLRCEFRRPARNETMNLFIPGVGVFPSSTDFYDHLAMGRVHEHEWPLSCVFVLRNRITHEVRVIALDLDGREARPVGRGVNGPGDGTTAISRYWP